MRSELEGDFQDQKPLRSGTLNTEHGTRNTEHGTVYLHSLVALPHLRFPFSAINTKWEGDIQDPKPFRPETRNAEHGTLNMVPPLFSRIPTSKIHVFCNQHQVGG